MIRNIFNQLKTESSKAEFLSLDDYVLTGEKKNTLYLRIQNDGDEFSKGDLLVCNCAAQPKPSDVVLCFDGDSHSIKTYSDIKSLINPLRLAARDGRILETGEFFDRFEVVGVVTHCLKTL